MKAKSILTILTIALAVLTCAGQENPKPGPKPPAPAVNPLEQPHRFDITPEEKARKNPVRFTDVSVEQGKKIYMSQCAMCHGAKGDGKGELANEIKITPPDFTKAGVLDKRTDGELFAILSKGSPTMPGQGGRMTVNQRWEVVNFLRFLEGKTPAKATAKEREEMEHERTVVIPQ
jgi:cytochrome c5